MENNERDIGGIAALTRYFFRCPPAKHIVIVMFFSALLFPIAGSDIFSKTGYFVFLFIPAFLTSQLSWRAIQKLGGNFVPRHSYFLSTVSMISIAVLLAVVSLIEKFYIFKTWSTIEILFVGLAAVFMLHLLVYSAVGMLSIYRASIPAALYLIFSALILYSFKTVTIRNLSRFATLVFVSFFIIWLFIKLTDAPFKRTLGISTSDLISLAISEYINPEQAQKNPFSDIGKKITIPFQALKFKTKKESYAIAVPWLHPGPIESVGGKLPRVLNSTLRENFSDSVFFHTYVDHTLNPTSINNVVGGIVALMSKNSLFKGFCQKASKFIIAEKNGARVLAQKIGKHYFFITTFAPKLTEDIVPAVGLSLLEKFSNNAIFVDAHNSFTAGEDEIENIGFGDERVKNLALSLEMARKKVDSAAQHKFKIKILTSEQKFLDYGINEVSLIAFEIAGQKAAIAVLDANNLNPQFRAALLKELKSIGFEISEVVTTDAHLGDFLVKKYGQTGVLGADIVRDEITSLAKKALAQLEPAKASYLYTEIETKVFGEKSFHQLIATAHSLIPFAKFLTVSLTIAFLFAAYVILQLF